MPERGGVRPDRLHSQGSELVVYRPKPPPPASQQGLRLSENTAGQTAASRTTSPLSAGSSAMIGAGTVSTIRSRPGLSGPVTSPNGTITTAGANPSTGATGGTAGTSESRSFGQGVYRMPAPAQSQPVGRAVSPGMARSSPGNPGWGQPHNVPESTPSPWQHGLAQQTVEQPIASGQQNAPEATYPAEPPATIPSVNNGPASGYAVRSQTPYYAPHATHAGPSYNPPAYQPQPIPAAPIYNPAPVPPRSAPPVQNYSAPAQRPAPQAAPAPAQTSSSARRQ
jgi:hypothetical protein